jgi:hypothetical protein
MTACTVLSAHRNDESSTKLLSQERLRHLWAVAERTLERLETKHPLAARYATTLHHLRKHREDTDSSKDKAASSAAQSRQTIVSQQMNSTTAQSTGFRQDDEPYDLPDVHQPPNSGPGNNHASEGTSHLQFDQSLFWPLFQDLHGPFAEAIQSDGSLNQSWYWTPL